MQKIRLINDTKLSLSEVGEILDIIIRNGKIDTHYYNQIEYCEVIHNKITYQVQIQYLKTCTKYYIRKLEEYKCLKKI